MNAESCDGIYERPAGERLAKIASEIPGELAIVEIGVFRARSLLYLAEGSMSGNGAPVYGIDPWNLPRPSKDKYKSDETYRYAMDAIASSPAGFLVNPVRDFSTNVARSWGGPKVGLWHCDADHRYGPVMQDFLDWQPHLDEGAVLCWDDYHTATFPGVVKAVDELYANGRIRDLHIPDGCERLAVAKYTPWGVE